MRKAVKKFAEEMELVLQKNDHKGGWDGISIDYLEHRLVEEMGEYFAGCYDGNIKKFARRKELVDIANFCMMLHEQI